MSDEQKNGKLAKALARFREKLKNKKFLQLSLCVILGVVAFAIFLSSCSLTKSSTSTKQSTVSGSATSSNSQTVLSYSEEIERKLENVIESVKGCKNVKVLVVCESTPIITIAEQIETKTTNSGENSTISKYPVYEENGSSKTPMILYQTAPKITGVLVVAKGAGDTATKLKLVSAIQTLLGIDATKIDVLEGE